MDCYLVPKKMMKAGCKRNFIGRKLPDYEELWRKMYIYVDAGTMTAGPGAHPRKEGLL
jgi:hypothetical protein